MEEPQVKSDEGLTGSRLGPPAAVRYALFDFDGVVADTEPLYLALDRRCCEHFGYEPTAEELRGFVGHPSELAAPKLLATRGIRITSDDWCRVWHPSEEVYGAEGLAPSRGLAELWERLVRADIAVGVVSTSLTADLVRALNQFGLLRHVSVIVGRELAGRRKPAPDPYLRALAWLVGCKPTSSERLAKAAALAVAVEDSPTGIAAARAAHIHTFAYTGGSVAQDTSAASETVGELLELADRLGI